jgi:hypothetical protein
VTRRARWLGAALCAAIAAVPAGAGAQAGGGTAPAYPGNTLTLERSEPIVAGTVVTVRLSGHAEWGEPTDDTTIAYDLSIYAQNADVHPTCEVSLSAQRQKAINIPNLGASETLGDFVLDGDLMVNPAPPATGVDWSGESLPFVITPGVRNLLLCGFQRYIIDDVAWFALPVRVRQPSCRLLTPRVRHGRKARVKCNASGDMTARVRRRGGRPRTIAFKVGTNGTGRLPTARLRRGTHRVTIMAGGWQMGASRRLVVR